MDSPLLWFREEEVPVEMVGEGQHVETGGRFSEGSEQPLTPVCLSFTEDSTGDS